MVIVLPHLVIFLRNAYNMQYPVVKTVRYSVVEIKYGINMVIYKDIKKLSLWEPRSSMIE